MGGRAFRIFFVLVLGSATVWAEDRYVSLSGGHAAPFTNWAGAATNIQAAINASSAGDTVWVTNGVYDTGGVAGYPAVTNLLTNRVAIHKPITVRSVNGPVLTSIKGRYHSGSVTNGNAAVRCVYMTNGANLIGFTLTNGATRSSGDSYRERNGGGLWCESTNVVVSNCTITGNAANNLGGGVNDGTLYNCTLFRNSASFGGGAYNSMLYDCTLSNNSATNWGGGVEGGTLFNCTLFGNWAVYGGGADDSMLYDSTLSSNMAFVGGGADECTLSNCTLSGNAAGYGGGADRSVLYDCRLSNNSATNWGGGVEAGTLYNCTLSGNWANFGGGADNSMLYDSMLSSNLARVGGGADECTLSNCTLSGNAAGYGGGAGSSALYDCTLSDNSATNWGGGTYGCTLNNCTLSGNWGNWGGGAETSTLYNCTLSGNWAVYGGGADKSTLYDCTLTDNWADEWGGGVVYGAVNNSTFSGNSAGMGGGGAESATLNNCTLFDNWAVLGGGGSSDGTVNNCTISGNSAGQEGGGIWGGTLNNCIVYYNDAPRGPNHTLGVFANSCTTPYPGGTGNMTNQPGIVSPGNPRLLETSACLNAGDDAFVSWTLDRDDEPRTNGTAVDIGSDEYWAAGITGALTAAIVVDYTNVAAGYTVEFQTDIGGRVRGYTWSFGDGGYAANDSQVLHAFATAGVYDVVLEVSNYTGSVAATVTVQVVLLEDAVHYVAPGGGHVAPFTNWVTAATNIQAAVEVCIVGGTVWVSNGVYGTGGVNGYPQVTDLLTNRVAIHKAITVRSVNGPEVTVIEGQGPIGDAAVRCVYVADGARLIGFTLTNGATRAWAIVGDPPSKTCGGGAWCESVDAVLSNCVITHGSASATGGGTSGGTINNCTLSDNTAFRGGGANNGTLNNCTITGNSAVDDGGGTFYSTLKNCTLIGNWAKYGGGSQRGTLYNCTLFNNSATRYGGGSSSGTLNNCTLSGNAAADAGGGVGGGTQNNCIVYYNTAPSGPNYTVGTYLTNSCTTPDPGGAGNITNEPSFVDLAATNLRLNADSPCIDAGRNEAWMTGTSDLDDNPRLFNGRVDMGAYEYTIASDLRALLEGPYDAASNAMIGALPIPTNAPYCEDPRNATAIPTNAVDWVLAQLLETNGLAVAASRSVFVRDDGVLLTDAGVPGVRLECTPNCAYYVVVKHRNHLSAMSAQPVAYTNTLVSYDFRTDSGQYQGGTNGAVELEPSVWGLAVGDADGDGRVKDADVFIVQQQAGRTNYLPGDLDLDGAVGTNDEALALNRLGRVTAATNGAVALCPQLVVKPSRKTVVAENTVTLGASGSTNTITWFGLE
ncbi:MAG: PKD domain-containing protein, partial [bacterium]